MVRWLGLWASTAGSLGSIPGQGISILHATQQASQVTQWVKNLPAMQEMQETQVRSLGQGDLEEGLATHSTILAWRVPGRLQSTGLQRVGHDWMTKQQQKETRKWEERVVSLFPTHSFPFLVLFLEAAASFLYYIFWWGTSPQGPSPHWYIMSSPWVFSPKDVIASCIASLWILIFSCLFS